jgi:hypothetical protein
VSGLFFIIARYRIALAIVSMTLVLGGIEESIGHIPDQMLNEIEQDYFMLHLGRREGTINLASPNPDHCGDRCARHYSCVARAGQW